MSSSRRPTVRMGLITLFTLVIMLSLAVMAVLSITTSKAQLTMAQRYATSTSDAYDLETKGNEFLASLDSVLAQHRAAGATLSDASGELSASVASIGTTATTQDIVATASMQGSSVSASFVNKDGRQLSVTVALNNDLTYSISQWKLISTRSNGATSDTLWSTTN